MYLYIFATTNKEHESVTTEHVGEQMLMPARQRKRGNRMEVLPEAHRRSSEQREPPETCTKESCGDMENEREKRPDSVRQHFVLSTRDDPFSLLVSLLL